MSLKRPLPQLGSYLQIGPEYFKPSAHELKHLVINQDSVKTRLEQLETLHRQKRSVLPPLKLLVNYQKKLLQTKFPHRVREDEQYSDFRTRVLTSEQTRLK